jgi:hypothetical protein
MRISMAMISQVDERDNGLPDELTIDDELTAAYQYLKSTAELWLESRRVIRAWQGPRDESKWADLHLEEAERRISFLEAAERFFETVCGKGGPAR